MKSKKYGLAMLGFLLLVFNGCEGLIDSNEELEDIKNGLKNTGLNEYISKLPDELHEISGIIYFNETFWAINDGGNGETIIGLDPSTGNITQRVTVENVTNTDWEEISHNTDYVYVGDFGNNNGTRTDLRILKIDKTKFPASGDGSVNAEVIEFYYEDQTSFESLPTNTPFDCEAFVVINDTVHVFSKDWVNQLSTIYTFPAKEGKWMAQVQNTLNVQGLVTASDIDYNTDIIILAGYTKTYIPFLAIVENYSSPYKDITISTNQKFLSDFGTQVEGICYFRGDTIILCSEKSAKTNITQKLFYYR